MPDNLVHDLDFKSVEFHNNLPELKAIVDNNASEIIELLEDVFNENVKTVNQISLEDIKSKNLQFKNLKLYDILDNRFLTDQIDYGYDDNYQVYISLKNYPKNKELNYYLPKSHENDFISKEEIEKLKYNLSKLGFYDLKNNLSTRTTLDYLNNHEKILASINEISIRNSLDEKPEKFNLNMVNLHNLIILYNAIIDHFPNNPILRTDLEKFIEENSISQLRHLENPSLVTELILALFNSGSKQQQKDFLITTTIFDIIDPDLYNLLFERENLEVVIDSLIKIIENNKYPLKAVINFLQNDPGLVHLLEEFIENRFEENDLKTKLFLTNQNLTIKKENYNSEEEIKLKESLQKNYLESPESIEDLKVPFLYFPNNKEFIELGSNYLVEDLDYIKKDFINSSLRYINFLDLLNDIEDHYDTFMLLYENRWFNIFKTTLENFIDSFKNKTGKDIKTHLLNKKNALFEIEAKDTLVHIKKFPFKNDEDIYYLSSPNLEKLIKTIKTQFKPQIDDNKPILIEDIKNNRKIKNIERYDALLNLKRTFLKGYTSDGDEALILKSTNTPKDFYLNSSENNFSPEIVRKADEVFKKLRKNYKYNYLSQRNFQKALDDQTEKFLKNKDISHHEFFELICDKYGEKNIENETYLNLHPHVKLSDKELEHLEYLFYLTSDDNLIDNIAVTRILDQNNFSVKNLGYTNFKRFCLELPFLTEDTVNPGTFYFSDQDFINKFKKFEKTIINETEDFYLLKKYFNFLIYLNNENAYQKLFDILRSKAGLKPKKLNLNQNILKLFKPNSKFRRQLSKGTFNEKYPLDTNKLNELIRECKNPNEINSIFTRINLFDNSNSILELISLVIILTEDKKSLKRTARNTLFNIGDYKNFLRQFLTELFTINDFREIVEEALKAHDTKNFFKNLKFIPESFKSRDIYKKFRSIFNALEQEEFKVIKDKELEVFTNNEIIQYLNYLIHFKAYEEVLKEVEILVEKKPDLFRDYFKKIEIEPSNIGSFRKFLINRNSKDPNQLILFLIFNKLFDSKFFESKKQKIKNLFESSDGSYKKLIATLISIIFDNDPYFFDVYDYYLTTVEDYPNFNKVVNQFHKLGMNQFLQIVEEYRPLRDRIKTNFQSYLNINNILTIQKIKEQEESFNNRKIDKQLFEEAFPWFRVGLDRRNNESISLLELPRSQALLPYERFIPFIRQKEIEREINHVFGDTFKEGKWVTLKKLKQESKLSSLWKKIGQPTKNLFKLMPQTYLFGYGNNNEPVIILKGQKYPYNFSRNYKSGTAKFIARNDFNFILNLFDSLKRKNQNGILTKKKLNNFLERNHIVLPTTIKNKETLYDLMVEYFGCEVRGEEQKLITLNDSNIVPNSVKDLIKDLFLLIKDKKNSYDKSAFQHLLNPLNIYFQAYKFKNFDDFLSVLNFFKIEGDRLYFKHDYDRKRNIDDLDEIEILRTGNTQAILDTEIYRYAKATGHPLIWKVIIENHPLFYENNKKLTKRDTYLINPFVENDGIFPKEYTPKFKNRQKGRYGDNNYNIKLSESLERLNIYSPNSLAIQVLLNFLLADQAPDEKRKGINYSFSLIEEENFDSFLQEYERELDPDFIVEVAQSIFNEGHFKKLYKTQEFLKNVSILKENLYFKLASILNGGKDAISIKKEELNEADQQTLKVLLNELVKQNRIHQLSEVLVSILT